MEKALSEWIKGKRKLVNQLLDEGYSNYSKVSKQDPLAEMLQYRHYISQSEQGKEITQIIKEVSKKINGQYQFQMIVCDHYEDYLTKLDTVNQVTNFPFEHNWEESHNMLEDPIVIVANKEYVEIYSIDETRDLVSVESRINEELSA